MIDQNTRWCDKCGYHIRQEWIEAQECPFWGCPMEAPVVVDTGGALHKILGEALAQSPQETAHD